MFLFTRWLGHYYVVAKMFLVFAVAVLLLAKFKRPQLFIVVWSLDIPWAPFAVCPWFLSCSIIYKAKTVMPLTSTAIGILLFWIETSLFFQQVIWFDLRWDWYTEKCLPSQRKQTSLTVMCCVCCSKHEKSFDTVALSCRLQPSKTFPVLWTVCSNWPKVNRETSEQWEKESCGGRNP